MKLIDRMIDRLAARINERVKVLQLRDYYDNNCQCKAIAEAEPAGPQVDYGIHVNGCMEDWRDNVKRMGLQAMQYTGRP